MTYTSVLQEVKELTTEILTAHQRGLDATKHEARLAKMIKKLSMFY